MTPVEESIAGDESTSASKQTHVVPSEMCREHLTCENMKATVDMDESVRDVLVDMMMHSYSWVVLLCHVNV